MQTRHRFITAGAALSLTLILSACGGGHDTNASSSSSVSVAATADHNSADVTFVKGMIPHHAQAIEMADLASTRASSTKVKDLAARIKGEQDPEIKSMKGWLTSWGEQAPSTMSGMDHGSDPGMMTAGEMTDLTGATGGSFDKMFLEMMVKHHEGAVTMAKTEQSSGKYGPAKDLADAIIAAQDKEITEMKALLAGT